MSRMRAKATGVIAGEVITPYYFPLDITSHNSICLSVYDYIGIQVQPDDVQEVVPVEGLNSEPTPFDREWEVTDPYCSSTLLTITIE